MTEGLVLVSLAGVLACGACGESAGPTRTAVAVDVSTPGRAVPDDFLGVPVEWNSVREYLGDGTDHARAAAVTLLAAFAAEGHRPEVRIGGNSEDQAWRNPSGDERWVQIEDAASAAHMNDGECEAILRALVQAGQLEAGAGIVRLSAWSPD